MKETDERELPIYSESEFLGDFGVRKTESIICDEMHYIFRRLDKNDLGIDGNIEILSEKKRGTGRLIAVQIKCGNSFFKEVSEYGYVFRGEMKHFYYWKDHSLPVILVICNPQDGDCYWVHVTQENAKILKEAWRIIVPFNNKLCVDSKNSFESIANRFQSSDIAELLLYRLLCEKYQGRIRIAPLMQEPHDFHGLSHVVEIDGKFAMVGMFYDNIGKIKIENLEKFEQLYAQNMQAMGWDICFNEEKLLLFIVSKSKDALILDEQVVHYLDKLQFIDYFRVIYEEHPFYFLTELDNDNNLIYDYHYLETDT